MKHFRHIPIHLALDSAPCVHCGNHTTWRIADDLHPCCPICYHTKELGAPKLPMDIR